MVDDGAFTDATGRAQAALDRLVRDSGSTEAPRGRRVRVAALVLATVAVILVLVFRRPAPVEESLPMVADSAAESAGSESDGSESGGSGSDTGSEQEVATTVADAGLVVHVVGAVASPGVVTLGAGSRVVDAVTAAGGLRPDADPDRVNLAAPLEDGQRVVVPVVGQEPPTVVGSGGTGGSSAGDGSSSAGSQSAPIDLNSATAQDLETLPGVGPATSSAIISHREKEGPFRSVDDLLDVRGIGEAKLDALRDLVSVGS